MSTSMNKNKFSTLWTRSIGILSLALVPFLTSCLNNDDKPLEPAPVAYVSFYHGSPSLPSIQIAVDHEPYNSNTFDYSTYFDYGRFYTGKRNFSFKAGNASNSLLDTLVNFEADKAYSFFLSEEEEGSFVPVIVEDDLESPSSGKAMVRLVHLSPDAAKVNLKVGDKENDLFEDQEFRDVTDFVEVEAGRVNFDLLSADNKTSLVKAESVNLREGRIYTLVVRGYKETSSSVNGLSLQLVRNYPNY